MDFYWHYVSKDTIDDAGKNSFLRAISIASQVFNSISEYIQVDFHSDVSVTWTNFTCPPHSSMCSLQK